MNFISPSVFCQTSDLARVEYTYIPQRDSENRLDRFRVFARFPIKVSDSSYFIPGVEYRKTTLDIGDPVPFSIEELNKFQLFRTGVAFTAKIKNDWRIVASAGFEVASNFERRKVLHDDIRFTGALFFIKDRSGDGVIKPDRWIIGLNYSTNAGRPFPIPLLNYYKKINQNWSYTAGVPKSNLKYGFTEKHTIQSFITLDGFFSNLQSNLLVDYGNNTTRVADNISMTIVMGGLGYEYYFTKNILFYFYGAHSFYNEIRLRDNRRNNLYNINDKNTFYLRSGIKLKI